MASPFQLQIEGSQPLQLTDAILLRELGAPILWHFIADLKSASLEDAPEPGFMALFRTGKAVSVKAVWGSGGPEISTSARVTGFTREDQWTYSDRLDIFAESTVVNASGANPFVPRRRVLQADNMMQLFDRFKHIAVVNMNRLRDALTKITFPDNPGKACIVQDGLSDWDFFGAMMEQCRFMSPGANWLPLTLVGGSVNGPSVGQWLVVPGVAAPYRGWGEVDGRKQKFTDADGPARYGFGKISGASRSPEFPSGNCPSLGIEQRWRKDFSEDAWKKWRDLDTPIFMGESGSEDMVWRIADRVYNGPENNIQWQTLVNWAPPLAEVATPRTALRLTPWIGCGQVSTSDRKGPWIQVKLSGFESGADTIDVRLATPFSGADGTKGLHYVPEADTKVEVCWPGRFDTSVVLIGNTRWGAAQFTSPSIYLEETHTTQFEDVNVKKIGQVTVASSLNVGVNSETNVNSQNQLHVQADGADLKLSGGIVYTGRGM